MKNTTTRGITLADFRPQPQQEELLRAMKDHRLYEALVLHANRSGASTAAAAWIASMATDRPITTNNGESLFMRPDSLRGIPLTLWCVANDWHAIKEQVTGLLLSLASNDYLGLISMRHFLSSGFKQLDGIVWEDKQANILKSITLHNGTRIVFQPSDNIDWMSGERLHGVWIDETLKDHSVYGELAMRAIDSGKLVWTISASADDGVLSPSSPSKTIVRILEKAQWARHPSSVFRFRANPLAHLGTSPCLAATPETISLLADRIAILEQQIRKFSSESDVELNGLTNA